MTSAANLDIHRELDFARRAFVAGEWSISEIVCRNILDREPGCNAALELLGFIAGKAGALEQASAYFKAALARASPGRRTLKRILFTRLFLHNAVWRLMNRAPEDRYLLIKSWGAGFWSDVSHVLGCLLLAEITGRIPIVHWGKNSLYGDASHKDVFQNYFKPVSSFTLTDIRQMAGTTFFPSKWTRDNLTEESVAKWRGKWSRLGAVQFLNRSEKIAVADFYIGVVYAAPWIPRHHAMHGKTLEQIYTYLINKYLHVQPTVLARCDAFFDQHLTGTPFVAVHIRGSDKVSEGKDLQITNRAIQDAIAAEPASHRIFLLTDDEHHLAHMKDLYGDRIVSIDCQRTNTSTGTHLLSSVDRGLAGMEIMVDTYLALRADRFIGGGGSNVSTMIAVMRDWSPGTCMMIGKSQLVQRHLSVYLPKNKDPRTRAREARDTGQNQGRTPPNRA